MNAYFWIFSAGLWQQVFRLVAMHLCFWPAGGRPLAWAEVEEEWTQSTWLSSCAVPLADRLHLRSSR